MYLKKNIYYSKSNQNLKKKHLFFQNQGSNINFYQYMQRNFKKFSRTVLKLFSKDLF